MLKKYSVGELSTTLSLLALIIALLGAFVGSQSVGENKTISSSAAVPFRRACLSEGVFCRRLSQQSCCKGLICQPGIDNELTCLKGKPILSTTIIPSPKIIPSITLAPKPQIEQKVMLLVVNPYLETKGKTLIDYMQYKDPTILAKKTVDAFNSLQDRSTTHPMHYKIVETQELTEFPTILSNNQLQKTKVETDLLRCVGNLYNYSCQCDTEKSQCNSSCQEGVNGVYCSKSAQNRCKPCVSTFPSYNYQSLFDKYDLCKKIETNRVNELWIATYPYSPFGESDMIGPRPYSINGGTSAIIKCKDGTKLTKNIVTIGIDYSRSGDKNYPRGDDNIELNVADNFHALVHRIEKTMGRVYKNYDPVQNWGKFVSAPKYADAHEPVKLRPFYGCGSAHFPPNDFAEIENFDIKAPVESICDNFLNYPEIDSSPKSINCDAWGCTKMGYYRWWLAHVPNSNACLDEVGCRGLDGKRTNWWEYIFNPSLADKN